MESSWRTRTCSSSTTSRRRTRKVKWSLVAKLSCRLRHRSSSKTSLHWDDQISRRARLETERKISSARTTKRPVRLETRFRWSAKPRPTRAWFHSLMMTSSSRIREDKTMYKVLKVTNTPKTLTNRWTTANSRYSPAHRNEAAAPWSTTTCWRTTTTSRPTPRSSTTTARWTRSRTRTHRKSARSGTWKPRSRAAIFSTRTRQ